MSPVEKLCANAAADGHYGETIGPKLFGEIPCRGRDIVYEYYPTLRSLFEQRAQIGYPLATYHRWCSRGYPTVGHGSRERKDQRRVPTDKLFFLGAKCGDVIDKCGPEIIAPFANLIAKPIALNDRQAMASAGDGATQIGTAKIRNKKWHAATTR